MRVSLDKGFGSGLGRYLTISFGPGWGYMRDWWVSLNRGPGNAVLDGIPCGHKGLYHCNSFYCTRKYCNWIPRIPFVSRGATLRVWVGPTYLTLSDVRSTVRLIRHRQRQFPTQGYRFVSFKF